MKKANAKLLRERERERERDMVVQVSHRYGRMKIRIFSLLFVEVIVKIPMYSF